MHTSRLIVAESKALSARARSVANLTELLAQRTGIHCLELEPARQQILTPAIWQGEGNAGQFRSRTKWVPAVRLYVFCDSPIALGRTAIINAGQYSELDYASFSESSRFNEGLNRALVADWPKPTDLRVGRGPDQVALKAPADTLHISGDCAVMTQQADHAWGHWLVDVLPRLEVVRRLMPDITFAFSNLLTCAEELLERTGLRPHNMLFYDPYKTTLSADRLFLPGYVRFSNAFAPASRDIFSSLAQGPRRRINRIYVSRSMLKEGSTIVNHEEIEALFVRRGFNVVHPQFLSIAAQIAMFAEASHIAGEYGSGLHSSVFSAPGTPVLCLQSKSMNQFVQAGIGQVMSQPTGFIFGEPQPDPFPEWRKSGTYAGRYCSINPAFIDPALDQLLPLYDVITVVPDFLPSGIK
jgi:hypothetical protein